MDRISILRIAQTDEFKNKNYNELTQEASEQKTAGSVAFAVGITLGCLISGFEYLRFGRFNYGVFTIIVISFFMMSFFLMP